MKMSTFNSLNNVGCQLKLLLNEIDRVRDDEVSQLEEFPNECTASTELQNRVNGIDSATEKIRLAVRILEDILEG